MKEKIGSALILAALLAVVFGIVMSNAAADAERKAYYETLSAEAKAESKALLGEASNCAAECSDRERGRTGFRGRSYQEDGSER